MFLFNVGYQWSIPASGPDGVIFNASGFDFESAQRRDFPKLPEHILFDPQLYLLELACEVAPRTCTRLATYPWCPIEAPTYDSGELNRRDWLEEVEGVISPEWPPALPSDRDSIHDLSRQSIEFQQEFGVSEIILPSPLTNSPDSDLSIEMIWIDEGAALASGSGLLSWATFAISDSCLLYHDPADNELLQAAIDQLTAREELHGVYVVIEQSREESSRIIHARVAQALLELCHHIGYVAGKKVLINFADTFGIACLAAGASGFATGFSRKSKRLSFGDFAERGGGGAFPKFYAHSTICDYLPERDLERLRDNHLLRFIGGDRTPASAALFHALDSGASVSSVAEWRESLNNLSGAKEHYIQRVLSSVEQISELSENEKRENVLAWLQDAERTVNYLNERFADEPLNDDGRHVRAWRSAFEWYVRQYF